MIYVDHRLAPFDRNKSARCHIYLELAKEGCSLSIVTVQSQKRKVKRCLSDPHRYKTLKFLHARYKASVTVPRLAV